MDHLLCSNDAAGMAAHAIRHHGQRYAPASRMRQDGHPVLLLTAITLMLGDTGIN
jgi:hypothetical protein